MPGRKLGLGITSNNKRKGLMVSVDNLGSPIDYIFDQSSCDSYVILDITPTIRLVPERHFSGNWAHWAVRSRHWTGKTPHFLISKSAQYNLVPNERLAVWSQSPDTDQWNDFDNVIQGASDLEIYNNTPFPSGIIYISPLPLYPFDRITRKVKEWLINPLVSDTPSSTNGVIGFSTSRNAGDGSGRIVPVLPYYGFKISNGAGSKNNVILTSCNHPSETPGPYQLEGAIDWLLGGSDLASYFLQYNNVFVYPCLNPQGVWAGYFRTSPQTPAGDNNRLWNTTGTNEAIDAFKTAMAIDTGSVIASAMDFHAWMDERAGFCTFTNDSFALPIAFQKRMKVFDNSYTSADSDIPESLKAWQESTLGAVIAGGPEFGGALTKNITHYKANGGYVMSSLALLTAEKRFTYGPTPGSRSFNGTTDRIDWTSVANLTNSPITISAWVYNSGAGATSDYIINIHPTGDAAFGIVFYLYDVNLVGFIRNGTQPYTWATGQFANWTNSWHHVLVTHDGTYDYSKIHIYLDGIESVLYANQQNGSAESTMAGSWSVDGRKFDDIRNFNGRISQVGVWNRVLTSTEITNLAIGYAPSRDQSGLQFYFPGNTSSLAATPGGTGTADGSTSITGVDNGPGIIYP